uniref:copper amine oxidase N-terminal domain-containing protein n=2 Tax=Peptoniphilus lacrimalis TaxID=33031 RepID=UPI0023F6BACA
ENTFYVLKGSGKTLADLASKAPKVTAKTGFKVTGWDPALDATTAIDGNLTVNATFEKVTVTPAPTPTPTDPIVGPVDPSVNPNPDESKNWTVTFAADANKGTIVSENTFYVLKGSGKTLADLANAAPEVTAKPGYEFDKWEPALDANTTINKDMTVKAYFKQAGTTPTPQNPYDHNNWWYTPFRPSYSSSSSDTNVNTNVTKKVSRLEVRLVIGSKELRKSIDGIEERIMMDIAPFIEGNRTMLPIRFVAEALGFNVQWDKDSRTVILIDNENVVKIPVDTNKIIVNGKEYISDVKPVIRNNRTMLPIANIARALGLKDGKDIFWNGNTKEVLITREVSK